AEKVREPAGAGINVDGADDDVCPVVEELLRAVAVMRVDVEHGNRPAGAFDELGGCNRRVVQVTGAAVTSMRSVMAGRPAAAVRSRLSAEHEVDRGPGRLPGAGADQGHRVVREVTGLRPGGGRNVRRAAGGQRSVREHVRNHAVLSRVFWQSGGGPLLPGRREV